METNEIIAQVFGFLALGLLLISFQFKSNKTLLILQSFGNLLFCIQYIFLHTYSGCICVLVLVRNLTVAFQDKYKILKWKGWEYILLILFLVSSIFTWEGLKSILPLIGCIGSTIAYFKNNARVFRSVTLFITSPCWLTYDALSGAYAGIINEIITIISIVISIIRFGWKKLGEDEYNKEQKNG